MSSNLRETFSKIPFCVCESLLFDHILVLDLVVLSSKSGNHTNSLISYKTNIKKYSHESTDFLKNAPRAKLLEMLLAGESGEKLFLT